MLNTHQLLGMQEKRKNVSVMVSEVFYFASEYVQLKGKQCEQVSLCCWTICPIINLLWMPEGITLSHRCNKRKNIGRGSGELVNIISLPLTSYVIMRVMTLMIDTPTSIPFQWLLPIKWLLPTLDAYKNHLRHLLVLHIHFMRHSQGESFWFKQIIVTIIWIIISLLVIDSWDLKAKDS